jgi:hypothetical protein
MQRLIDDAAFWVTQHPYHVLVVAAVVGIHAVLKGIAGALTPRQGVGESR